MFCSRLAALVACLAFASSVHAQQLDSTAAPLSAGTTDSTAAVAAPPPTRGAALLGFGPLLRGTIRTDILDPTVGDTILAAMPEIDAPDVLADVPGAFVYRFGAYGWPDGWSPLGLPPHHVALTLDGLPFDDPLTGRPRYDLLPFELLEPLRQHATYGAPAGVAASLRAFDVPQPLTELRYRTGDDGLQRISALHRQARARRLFGRAGALGVLGAYGGQAADNEYPGSALRRGRQLLSRLRYTQTSWSAEVGAMHTRRTLGAQAGAEPLPGFPYETIYNRFTPRTLNDDATRRTRRTDAWATLRLKLLPDAAPLAVAAFGTVHGLRYRDPGADTLTARVTRSGLYVAQPMEAGAHRLFLTATAWRDRLTDDRALPGASPRTLLFASIHDAVRLGQWTLEADVTLSDAPGPTLTGGGRVVAKVGRFGLFGQARYARQPVGWVATTGFGRTLTPDASAGGAVATAQAGVTLQTGPFDLTLFGFAHRSTDAVDLFVTDRQEGRDDDLSSTLFVATLPLPDVFTRAGAGADAGWRRTAERGLYASVQPTVQHTVDADAFETSTRLAASLPDAWLRARLGARLLLFRGDLDLDVALRGHLWSRFQGRTLHPPTGLLVLPHTDARPVDASGTLDLVIVGGVRTARLFLVWENILSGTDLTVGNQLVPVYPLPERRLRFGVYWPILN